jgi:hypothetical protein
MSNLIEMECPETCLSHFCLSERRVRSADAKSKSGELLDGQGPNAEGGGAKQIRARSSRSCARTAHACAGERPLAGAVITATKASKRTSLGDGVTILSGRLLPRHLFAAQLCQCDWHAARTAGQSSSRSCDSLGGCVTIAPCSRLIEQTCSLAILLMRSEWHATPRHVAAATTIGASAIKRNPPSLARGSK